MNFEQPPVVEINNEKEPEPIILTAEERAVLSRTKNLEDPNILKLMEEKGITFDAGDVVIEVDGKKMMVTTSKDDFFTTLMPETIEEKYGREKRDAIEAK